MLLNGTKFEILRYGQNKDLKNGTMYFTPGMDEVIEEKESLRDLGVMMTNSASFNNHINLVCKKVIQKSGWIFRTFKSRDTFFLKYMWKSLIQPHVDYCSQLYMPTNPGEMEKIGNLFRNFSKKIPALKGMDYWTRLKHLRMYSQQRRLERYRILYVWKIHRRIVPNCGLEFTSEETRRGAEVLIPNLKGTSKGRDQSFQVHGGKLFNSLPKYLRNMAGKNLDDFKEKLDNYLQSIPDEPKVDGYIPSACEDLTAKPSNSILFQCKQKIRNKGC